MPRAAGLGGRGLRRTEAPEEEKEAAAALPAAFQHPPSPLPSSLYLLVPVEPVARGRGEGAQVSEQPLPLQVELDSLQQPQGQAEHQRQVEGPRPVRLQPGGLHRSALRGWPAASGLVLFCSPGWGGRGGADPATHSRGEPAHRASARWHHPCFPLRKEEQWEGAARAWPEAGRQAGVAGFLALCQLMQNLIQDNFRIRERHHSSAIVFNPGRDGFRF